jgi:hypothetical protein
LVPSPADSTLFTMPSPSHFVCLPLVFLHMDYLAAACLEFMAHCISAPRGTVAFFLASEYMYGSGLRRHVAWDL